MAFSVRSRLDQFTLPHPSRAGTLTISVAPPGRPATDGRVAVLYVLDGDVIFGMASEIARAMAAMAGLPPLYVVGVGYDAEYEDFLRLRTADLSLPLTGQALSELGALADAIGAQSNGGADAFLSFLIDGVRPAIFDRYPDAIEGDQILFGHSLGGLFATNALLTRPESFTSFLVSSPSLWWNAFSTMEKLPAFADRLKRLPTQPRVFVDVGALEQDVPTSLPDGAAATLDDVQEQIRAARMVDAAAELAAALAEAGLEHLRHRAFAGEDHLSVVPPALLHGMRFALERAH